MLLGLLAACIENKLDDGPAEAFDSGEPPDTAADTAPPPPAEECNGVDDDGDGAVDEGFADVDGDGSADCVDDACALVTPAPRAEVDPDCQDPGVPTDPPADPWTWTMAWRNPSGTVKATPTVGDLDGDGKPEVVAPFGDSTVAYTGSLLVLDGGSGREELRIPGVDASSGTALGDLDGDGDGDIVALFSEMPCASGSDVRAYDATGAELWRQSGPFTCETYPAIGDLDGDGDPEVVASRFILDGATGALVADLPLSGAEYQEPVLVDMDADGDLEILVANHVIDGDGAELWTCTDDPFSTSVAVQFDADPAAELLVSGFHQLTLCDDGGREVWTRAHDSLGVTLSLADFDGDGELEFTFPNGSYLYLLELDGTEVWRTGITDPSCCGGAVSWDMDLDGVPEVVLADEVDVLVLDGRTGAVRIREESHASETLFDTPAVADVDGDGRGEIVYGSNRSGENGLTVLRGADWPWAPAVYNQQTYAADNVRDDLSIPLALLPPWASEAHLLRGQPSALLYAGDFTLDVAITDVCAASCESGGTGSVMVQVWNAGAVASPAATVELWADEAGIPVLVATTTAPAMAPATSAELPVEIPSAALRERLVARLVGVEGACDPRDGEAEWVEMPCAP